MLYVIDPEELKKVLLPLSLEERGKLITKAVGAMINGQCAEPWVKSGRKTAPPVPKAYTASFEDFWKHYPNKTGKKAAFKAWWKAAHQDFDNENGLHAACLTAMLWQTKTRQWQEGFIPHPATYLNQARWDDEPEKTEAPTEEKGGMDWNEFE